MILSLSPARGLPGQPETTLHVAGDVLTCGATSYDLTAVPEGGETWFEGDHPFQGPIRRIEGVIHASVLVLLDDTAAAAQPIDPAHWVVEVVSGPVAIPALRKAVDE